MHNIIILYLFNIFYNLMNLLIFNYINKNKINILKYTILLINL